MSFYISSCDGLYENMGISRHTNENVKQDIDIYKSRLLLDIWLVYCYKIEFILTNYTYSTLLISLENFFFFLNNGLENSINIYMEMESKTYIIYSLNVDIYIIRLYKAHSLSISSHLFSFIGLNGWKRVKRKDKEWHFVLSS